MEFPASQELEITIARPVGIEIGTEVYVVQFSSSTLYLPPWE